MADHLALLNRKLLDLSFRRIRRLIVQMPPRHGKSELCSKYLPPWYVGLFPEHRIVFNSYEADFAASWGRKSRDLLVEHGYKAFGLRVREGSSAVNRWDLQGHDGGMVTAGVGGAITGKGADLLIIDDYTKNSEEAFSKNIRDKTWEWWQSTAYTRLQPDGVVLVIATRWHQDDLIGRLLEKATSGGEAWDVVNLPALAEENDLIGRQPGEALWPSHYPRERLEEIRANIRSYWWNALYQQRPVVEEGTTFKRSWFEIVNTPPSVMRTVRFWDMAATKKTDKNDPDWTVGAKLGVDADHLFYLVDVKRVRASPLQTEQLIRQTAELDGVKVPIVMEQEPGASGVAMIDHFRRTVLPGFDFRAVKPQKDKVSRAGPVASMAEAGHVKLVRGPWINDFLDEVESFPFGAHDDMVDALASSFSQLTRGSTEKMESGGRLDSAPEERSEDEEMRRNPELA